MAQVKVILAATGNAERKMARERAEERWAQDDKGVRARFSKFVSGSEGHIFTSETYELKIIEDGE